MPLATKATWKQAKEVVEAMPEPVKEAIGQVGDTLLNELVPGGAPAIELTNAVFKWAAGGKAATQPPIASPDLEKATNILQIVSQKLDDLAIILDRMPTDKLEQGRDFLRWRLVHDTDMGEVAQELDEEVRGFSVVKQHYRNLLQKQGYENQLLEDLLSVTLRMIGLSELLPELDSAKQTAQATGQEFSDSKAFSTIKSYQDGARSFSEGQFAHATESFKQAATEVPKSAIATVAWATAKVANEPPHEGAPQRVQQIMARLPAPTRAADGRRRILVALKDDDIVAAFPNSDKAKDVILWNTSGLSDRGIQALCAILPNVTRLSIRKAKQITDGVIPQLCELRHLRRLLIWGSKLTALGKECLQKNRAWDSLNLR